MKSSRIALGGFGSLGRSAMAAMAAGLISRATGTRVTKSLKQLAAEDADRITWNGKVDAAKRNKNMGGSRVARVPKKRVLPSPSMSGCTVIGNLIYNYQVHSNNIMTPFTNQRALEYNRRVTGRTLDGMKAEAEHVHRARTKHQKKVSRMIGGRTLRVILQLSNHQRQYVEEKRDMEWRMWTPVDNGIWQYQVHDELFPYFMFNDEAGNLFEFDPAKLHFSNMDDCNQAMHLYIASLNAKTPEEHADAELAFTGFCELHGHTLQEHMSASAIEKAMTENPHVCDEDAGDENYALKG